MYIVLFPPGQTGATADETGAVEEVVDTTAGWFEDVEDEDTTTDCIEVVEEEAAEITTLVLTLVTATVELEEADELEEATPLPAVISLAP